MKAHTVFTKEVAGLGRPMAPEPDRPARRHLTVAPERPPQRPHRALRGAVISILTLVAMLGVGLGTYAWQHAQVQDQRTSAATALAARNAVAAKLAQAQGRNADLAALVSQVQKQLALARGRAGILHGRVRDLQDQLQVSAAAVTASQARLQELAGPPIADGRYLAFIKAIGTNQTPPMIVIDTAQWFEGQAADRAARKDGVLPPGQHVPDGYYIRNASPAWRTLEVGPDPSVSMIAWHNGALGWSRVTLGRLAKAFTTPNARHAGTNLAPFWVRVEGGLVVGIHEQYTP